MAGLLDFLGLGGGPQTGPLAPREMPRSIPMIDPNPAHAEGLAAMMPAMMPAAAPQGAPIASVDQERLQQGLRSIAPSAPNLRAPQRGGGGIRDFLGQLGDVLLVGNNMAPIYTPRKQQREMGEALAQYLGATDEGIAEVARRFPELAMKLFGDKREDARFERTAGQDDRRIGIGEGQLELGRGELDERIRSNKAGEQLTETGRDAQTALQLRLAQIRSAERAADRAFEAATKAGDREHSLKILELQDRLARERAALEGKGAGYEEIVMELPGQEAKPDTAWFGDNSQPATPSRKTTIRRPLATTPRPVTSKAQYDALASGETFTGPDGQTYRKP